MNYKKEFNSNGYLIEKEFFSSAEINNVKKS